MTLTNKGNTDDIRNSLRHSENNLTIKELEADIQREREGQNRKTVIKMLQAAINRKMKSKLFIEQ